METSQEHIFQVNKIEMISKRIQSQICIKDGQNIVAFIGPAKSGKSTLINCILKNRLKLARDFGTDETKIFRTTEEMGPIIDHNATIEDLIPQQYSTSSDVGGVMVDFPGFGNILGAEQEIASAMAYEKVLQSQKSVKFVLVVPIGLVKTDNPIEFFKLLSDLATLCPGLAGSLCIVATKSGKTGVAKCLQSAMDSQFLQANEVTLRVITNAKLILKKVLESKHYIDFKEPIADDNSNFIPPNLHDIINLIKNIKSKKIETGIPVSLSERSKLAIYQLHTTIESHLKNDIENISKYFEKQGIEGTCEEMKLPELIKIKKSLKNTADFESFVAKLKMSDSGNWSLIENLMAMSYVDLLLNKFQIGGCWDKKYADGIFDEIRTQIALVVERYTRDNGADKLAAEEATSDKHLKNEPHEKDELMKCKKMGEEVEFIKVANRVACFEGLNSDDNKTTYLVIKSSPRRTAVDASQLNDISYDDNYVSLKDFLELKMEFISLKNKLDSIAKWITSSNVINLN